MANFKNLASSFVVTPPSGTTGTSMTVTSGSGTFFPSAPFYVTLTPPASLSNPATSEIVLVTAVSTDTFTITRAQKNTTAQTIVQGWVVSNGIYTEDITASINFGVALSGTVDGSNKIFTVPSSTAVEIFRNGIRLALTGDYTFTNGTTITFVTAPASGAVLTANTIIGNQTFINGSNSLITDEPPTGAINGSNGLFTVGYKSYVGGSLEVFVNGIKQRRGVHFIETSPGAGTFTLSDAPLTGDDVMANYQYTPGGSGNADTTDGFHAVSTPTPNSLLPLDSNALLAMQALNFNTAQAIGGSGTAFVTSATTFTDIGLSGTVVIPTGATKLIVLGSIATSSQAAGQVDMQTRVVVGSTNGTAFQASASGTFSGGPTTVIDVIPVTAGTYTVKLQGKTSNGVSSAWFPVYSKVILIPVGA